jgi:arsenical pump membrane protein
VLVAGLLLIGLAAARDGLFVWLASRLDRVPGSGRRLFVAGMASVALVSTTLNLDTAVVFLTPVMIAAARRRGVDERPFLYGTIFMVNAGSLLLRGSNLTNLIVLANENATGSEFARRMLPAAIGAVVGTMLAVWLLNRRRLGGGTLDAAPAARPGWIGLAASVAAVVLLLVLREPALPIAALGLATVGWMVVRGGLAVADARAAVNPLVLSGIFALAVGLGALARAWNGPATLLQGSGRIATTAVGALSAVFVNNLPAAVLLSAVPPERPRALLIGLNLGPNLAVTGSLSAFLWLQAARGAGASPSIKEYSRLGVIVAPVGIACALGAIWAFAPAHS